MRLLTAKGVEDEGRRRRGGLGKKSSFANERIFRTEALELDEPLPSNTRVVNHARVVHDPAATTARPVVEKPVTSPVVAKQGQSAGGKVNE